MSQAVVIQERLRKIAGKAGHWTEIRYHRKASHVLGILKGEVSEMSSKHYEGVGLRCLVNGTWGFASTGDITEEGLLTALKNAEAMARELAPRKKRRVEISPSKNLAKGNFFLPGYEELQKM